MAGGRKDPERTSGRRSRAPFIGALLLGSLTLTGVLTWQAQYAARSHRAIAEGVLRDYAGLAADEYVRRAANELGYYGYEPLLERLGQQTGRSGRLPDRPGFLAGLDERTRRAADLPRSLFFYRSVGTPALTYDGNDPDVEAWLAATLQTPQVEAQANRRGHLIYHPTINSRRHTFLATPADGIPGAYAGFQVEPAALTTWFRTSFERAPLLPDSLTRGYDASGWVALAVHDAGEALVFQSQDDFSFQFQARREFGEAYGGILTGMTVTASIDPEAAPLLVIGGLPGSRLPVLLTLLGLAIGLFGAAVLLVRRERALLQLRADFVARVSHELRTPLTQIRMFAETLLLNRVRSAAERQRSLEIIDKESLRLTHLVENLLQFSRGDRGTLRLATRPRKLAPLLTEFISDFDTLARDRGVRFTTSLEEITVQVDEDALRQILLNLLDNAVKYGPANQEIAIATRRRNGAVQLRVDDQGPGVPAAERQRIWQRFHRLHRDATTVRDGTGIGLALVHELVALHGGRTWVEDGSLGGACFVVELPAAAGPETANHPEAGP